MCAVQTLRELHVIKKSTIYNYSVNGPSPKANSQACSQEFEIFSKTDSKVCSKSIQYMLICGHQFLKLLRYPCHHQHHSNYHHCCHSNYVLISMSMYVGRGSLAHLKKQTQVVMIGIYFAQKTYNPQCEYELSL